LNFFFFQAEDGIRDFHVTGVQTCALPICVGYALLVAGRQADVDDFYAAVEDRLPENVRARTREDSSERATEAADRAERFLSLTAVISVLLSAVAIAMSARRFAHRRMDTVALMKSLGATQPFVLAAAALQLVLVGLLGV